MVENTVNSPNCVSAASGAVEAGTGIRGTSGPAPDSRTMSCTVAVSNSHIANGVIPVARP